MKHKCKNKSKFLVKRKKIKSVRTKKTPTKPKKTPTKQQKTQKQTQTKQQKTQKQKPIEKQELPKQEKMEDSIFKEKINLSKPRKKGDPVDPSLSIQISSRKYWARNKDIRKPPNNLEKKFKKTRGNLKMPNTLKRDIY